MINLKKKKERKQKSCYGEAVNGWEEKLTKNLCLVISDARIYLFVPDETRKKERGRRMLTLPKKQFVSL